MRPEQIFSDKNEVHCRPHMIDCRECLKRFEFVVLKEALQNAWFFSQALRGLNF